MSPDSGSWRNFVTITGENFIDTQNEVYFDGDLATIISESATQLVVQPVGTVVADLASSRIVDISVITGQQASNAHAWQALPSGMPRFADAAVTSQISDITSDGTLIFYSDLARGIITSDPAKNYQTGILRGLGPDMLRPGAAAFHATYGLLVIDDFSVAGDLSQQELLAVDIATGDTQVLIGGIFGLANATDIAVDPANGDIYIATDPAGTTNAVWRLSSADGLEQTWGNANLDSAITSVAVVGANVFVGGQGANTGLFEFVAGSGGGGAVNTLKVLDNAVSPTSLAPNGADLMVLEQFNMRNVADLAMSPSTVTVFNTFPVSDAVDLTPVGGGFAFSNESPGGGAVGFAFFAPDAANFETISIAPSWGLVAGGFRSGDNIYFGSLYSCLQYGTPGELFRMLPDGSMEQFTSGTSCNYGNGVTSTGLIVTSDFVNNTVSTIDPATGTATVILDAADGVNQPIATMVGPNDAIYVGHVDLGTGIEHLALTDVNGAAFDSDWAPTPGVIATGGAVLGNQFVWNQVGTAQVNSVDPGTGAVTMDFVDPNQLSGAVYNLAATADGTVMLQYFTGGGAGLNELLGTGEVLSHFRSESTPGVDIPFGVIPLANGDFFMADLGPAVGDEADPLVVTP